MKYCSSCIVKSKNLSINLKTISIVSPFILSEKIIHLALFSKLVKSYSPVVESLGFDHNSNHHTAIADEHGNIVLELQGFIYNVETDEYSDFNPLSIFTQVGVVRYGGTASNFSEKSFYLDFEFHAGVTPESIDDNNYKAYGAIELLENTYRLHLDDDADFLYDLFQFTSVRKALADIAMALIKDSRRLNGEVETCVYLWHDGSLSITEQMQQQLA